MTFKWTAIPSLLVVAVFGLGLYTAKDWTVQAGLFPLAIGIPALLLALCQLVKDTVRGKGGAQSGDTARRADLPVDRDVPFSEVVSRAGRSFAWIFGLAIAIWAFSFTIAVPLFTFLYLYFQAREGWRVVAAMTLGLGVFQYILFDRIIHTNWPVGAFQQWINF